MNALDKISQDERVTVRKSGVPDTKGKCVVYWMQRTQRGRDNPALDVAIRVANELGKPVVVFFAPVPFYPNANLRHYRFLAEGIPDIAEDLAARRVGFVLRAYPEHSLLKFCGEVRAAIVIGDENPMREPEHWRVRVTERIQVPFWTIDADVVVPSRLLEKEQYAARTIRPRIHRLLPRFFVPAEKIEVRVPWTKPRNLHSRPVNEDFMSGWKIDRTVSPVDSWRGGSTVGRRLLNQFIRNVLQDYPKERNHPESKGTSRLSPYLHFGQISPLTVALVVGNSSASEQAKQAFLEQLIVRRELSVNFVRFNPAYDSMECLEPWASRTMAEHASDGRAVSYNETQLDQADTHDPLWNAAQKQMVLTGWMHNYLRMYWAKKILEWSPSLAVAYHRAVWLNDRYELDGRDPNGYAGIAWAIVGKHDRAWSERPVFGKIRYMSFASTSKKFDSKKYIEQIKSLEVKG
ncbi:MAG TPA: deoxyribodipyrimidine photo-lyase [Terriglobales bacterium]|nr:deoxyribodipyrimidine photo-lyase [Terriglobales bacterium]